MINTTLSKLKTVIASVQPQVKDVVKEGLKNRFFLRNYSTDDYEAIKDIPRVPVFLEKDEGVIAVSHPIDFTYRPKLTKDHIIKVVEDTQNEGAVVGSFCMSQKNVKVFGKEKKLYYVFDYSVRKDYRDQKITTLFNNHVEKTMKQEVLDNPECPPFFYASGTKDNIATKKRMSDLGIVPFCTQVQSGWKVDTKIDLPALPSDIEVQVRVEESVEKINKSWTNAFKDYNFTPMDFSDILDHCKQYCKKTYVLQFTKKGSNEVVVESSITIWNQDLLYTLKDSNGKVSPHRQLICCYSVGEEQYKDLAFQYLLKKVHNEQLKEGIDYLFIGLPETDPLIHHFPLIPGIRSLQFNGYLNVNNPKDQELLKEAEEKKIPMWNDPRDFGSLFLYKEKNEAQSL
ncbi:hypothetical protein DLAC_10090 [Tieghemostelium lacteum]|uniref:Uncharacterized protein n=1 Tax=Tieghemostelium lacteum TaxID=361077 RepID=A0A151Z642_TIELA|nr:hypothetical protein DLAC_10090 [Tieghemostelium lacteum]|eukprot:KYQ89426.1 hypothetical protein DLAC_10090 [Tieghemostelium lacteum]